MTKLDSSENLLQATGKRIVLKPAALTELINCWVINGLPQLVSPPIASSELPTFQPTPINLVSSTLVTPPELTELAERELLDEERILDELIEIEELDLIELELIDELEAGHPGLLITPNGDGCAVHVAREIQLLLFSYPHPLCVVTHKG